MAVTGVGLLLLGGVGATWYGLVVASRCNQLAARLWGSVLASAGVAALYFGISLIRTILSSQS